MHPAYGRQDAARRVIVSGPTRRGPLLNRDEPEHREDAGGELLVLADARPGVADDRPRRVALGPHQLDGVDGHPLPTDLDVDPGVRAQVVAPGRVGGRAAHRSEDQHAALAVRFVAQRRDALGAGAGAAVVQHDHGPAGERVGAAHPAAVAAELVDDRLVEGVQVETRRHAVHPRGARRARPR
jgi:hypothetical protein